jgi:hypothetical protein
MMVVHQVGGTMRKTALLLALTAIAGLGHAQTAKATYVPSRGIAARSAEVDAKVGDLTKSIAWHRSLDEAKEAARKSGKPIFWMHMLGDLSGMT